MTEEQASVESLTSETIVSDDPHAVLVEFSSVVADTQEYIIKVEESERFPDLSVMQYGSRIPAFPLTSRHKRQRT